MNDWMFANLRACLALAAFAICPLPLWAEDATAVDSPIGERLDQDGIDGTLVICGGGKIVEEARAAFASAVIADRPVVILASASAKPAKAARVADKWLQQQGVAETIYAHLRPASHASDVDTDSSSPTEAFVSPTEASVGDSTDDSEATARVHTLEAIAEAIGLCGGVWMPGGQQSRLARAYVGTEVERQLEALLTRGGVIGGTSAGAAIQCRTMIASGHDKPKMSQGLDLLPDAIIDQHFAQRQRLDRLRIAVDNHPDHFGLGIDEATAVLVRGRQMATVGDGAATIVLADGVGREAIEVAMPAGSLADLTQLRRSARWRAAGVDPGKATAGPREVPSGSLVIVGGGGMPKEVVQRFIELAGGSQAKIVVLPTAGPREQALKATVPGFLARADIAEVTMLPQSRLDEVESETFREAVQQATGVWFEGGRQWNFVDAYENSGAIELFRDVLRRGGVIGGSSAGATIQGEYLVRGHPLGNRIMMAEGYERGFAFLPAVAIDQHFSQRGRFPDLLPVVRRNPDMVGIGVDESTALVVHGTRGEVLGRHAVHFLTADSLAAYDDEADEQESSEQGEGKDEARDVREAYLSVPAGGTINLKTMVPEP